MRSFFTRYTLSGRGRVWVREDGRVREGESEKGGGGVESGRMGEGG